jgi:hypothetical protein
MGPPAGSKGAKQSVGPVGGGPEALRIKLLGGFSVSVGPVPSSRTSGA